MEVRSSAVIVPRGPLVPPTKVVSPWADLPRELQGGYKSLNNCDYKGRSPLDASGSKTQLTSEELKQRWIKELRRRKAEDDERMFAARRSESRLLDEQFDKRIAPVEEVTVFDHRGKTVRSVTAPLEEFDARLEKASERELIRRSKVPTSPPRSFTPSADIADAMGTISFWYPADKQRLKFKMMEEARLAASRVDLVSHGWTTHCPPGGEDKKLGSLDRLAMSPEEAQRVEECLERFRQECEARDKEATLAEETLMANALDATAPLERRINTEGDADSRPTQATPHLDASLLALLTERTEGYQPPQVFRAELPASRLPKRLELPRALVKKASPAPPWGRQTEEEERWKKRAQYALEELQRQEDKYLSKSASSTQAGGSSSHVSILRPMKGDVDRELKVVRDGGLLKRPKQSVMKSVGAETLAFVKTLPKDFGKSTAGSRSMRPVPTPGAASLR